MPVFPPATLAAVTGGQWTAGPAVPLTGFTHDTRQLRTGQIFVAIKTEKRDGHDFLPAATQAGASAALVSTPNRELALPQLVVADPVLAFQKAASSHRQTFSGPVVGISGSCGKTSTKNLLALLLGGTSRVLATEGNLNNHLGVPLTLTGLENGRHTHAVIEAGISGPGEMDVLGGMIAPEIGIITLIAPAHTQELGGLTGVAREKARLLHHVKTGGLSVIPQQCYDFTPFQTLPTETLVLVPEETTSSARRQLAFRTWNEGGVTRLSVGGELFQTRLVSRGMAQNAALALAAARELGVSKDALQEGLLAWRPSPLRGEILHDHGRLFYVDCYNANPAAMADALAAFVGVAPEGAPRLYVLGGMEELGDEAPAHHRRLGEITPLRAQDEAFVIGPFAREVADGIASRGTSGRVEVVPGWEPVAGRIKEFSGSVFVKGSRRYELEKALPSQVALSPH